MNPIQRLRHQVASFLEPKVKNSNGVPIGQEFLRYGNRTRMTPDWSQVVMSDQDLYTGYMYGALTKRARRAAQIAVDAVKTKANDETTKALKEKDLALVHPYANLIENSPTFSDNAFWHDITTYLDLEGVYYLFVLRTVGKNKLGDVQEFKLLNPYNITRLKDRDSLTVQGYVERRGSFVREIPKEQIIEIRDLNPFDEDATFSMADAAKDSVFTLRQAGDYTRSSLKHNMKASGIVSTDLELTPEQLVAFRERTLSGNKGEPIFTDKVGGVKYQDMQIALDKAALKDISTMNVESTLVTTGVSKTIMGIEVSGVTRDTSETQSELFVTGEIMPRLQVIVDALNQDYRNNYPDDFKKYGYKLYLDSPLGADREAELQDISVRNRSYNLFATLTAAGYETDLAADFAEGRKDLKALGAPTNQPTTPVLSPDTTTLRETETPADTTNALAINSAPQALIDGQASTLEATVQQIEAQVAGAVLKKVTNAYDSQDDIISDQDREENERELLAALALFYAAILPIQAGMTMAARTKEFGKLGSFNMTPEVNQAIREAASKAATSHMDTILQDLLEAIQVTVITGGDTSAVVEAVRKAYPTAATEDITAALRTAAEKAARDGGKEALRIRSTALNLGEKYNDASFDDLLAAVRKAALDGASQADLQTAIRREYADISRNRAKLIARTETNRAFTTAQYEADKQFLKQNGLEGKAYKVWETHSPNPCPFCLSLAARGPIPFETNFASIGDVLSVTVTKDDGTASVRKMPVTYEDVRAGCLHPRCSCEYRLIPVQQ